MVFMEKPYVTIHWDDTVKCVHLEWRGFVQGDEFRNVMNESLKFIEQKKAQRWLADLRQLRVTSVSDQDWMVKEWLPRCIKSGIKKTAIIVPQFALGKMAVDRVQKQSKPMEMETAYFDNLEEAQRWFQS